MTNFQPLTDAFAELERQADAASATLQREPAVAARHRSRTPLVAASVIAVLGVAAGGTLLAHGHATHTPARTVAGGSQQPTSAMQSTAAVTFEMPSTPAELESRFRAVLGDTATFTVTDTSTPVTVTLPPPVRTEGPNVPTHSPNSVRPGGVVPSSAEPNGAAIVGTLTASGVTGGFDIQVFRATAGGRAMCDDPDRARCTVSRLADGSSLAVGSEPLQGGAYAVTYQVDLVRADGVEFIMHVSNERDPKGESVLLAAQPPLSRAQMTAIVTSDRW
jgi:hypothetical protein